MNTIHLLPAYGRDYKSRSALLDDWNNFKDFKLLTGSYANKQSFQHPTHIQFRYNALKSTFLHHHKP